MSNPWLFTTFVYFWCRYEGDQFDYEFVEILRKTCLHYIISSNETTVEEIVEFVNSSGVTSVRQQWCLGMLCDLYRTVHLKNPAWTGALR